MTLAILPRDVHALWRLLARMEAKSDDVHNIARREFERIDDSDVEHLLHAARVLRLLTVVGENWSATEYGKSLSNALHWRLWQPPDDLKPLLERFGLSNCFITAEACENRPIVVDLFSGVGGLGSGFLAAGFHVAAAVDNDPQACEAHRLNFPHTKVIEADVEEFARYPRMRLEEAGIPGDARIAGVVGGPPCQGFSYIGERKDGDERNALTERFVDVVLSLRPDFFVMENVPGLLTSGASPKFDVYLSRLAKSNGEPASRLAGLFPSIPKVPAKRSVQAKKKLASDIVRAFGALVEEYLERHLEATYEPERHVEFLRCELRRLLVSEIHRVYGDEALASRIADEGGSDLAAIALATSICHFCKHSAVAGKAMRSHFQRLVSALPKVSVLRDAGRSIDSFYSELPGTVNFKSRKIGPLLGRLLERLGTDYEVSAPQTLDAASYGTPQTRKRLFLVGIRKDLNRQFTFPEATHEIGGGKLQAAPTVSDAISDLPDVDSIDGLIDGHEFDAKLLGEPASEFARLMRLEALRDSDMLLPRPDWNPYSVDCSNRTTHEEHVAARLETLKPGDTDQVSRKVRLHPKQLAPTLRAGTKANKGAHTAVRPVHYKYHRVVSVREGARLMGYPDWMTFHRTKWHGFRLVGNGVPFPLSRAVADQVKKLLYAPLK